MDDKIAFVVMAAGMGRRYNGLKQLKTFGEKGLTIAEYNILNAIDCGFQDFFFVIDERLADIFNGRLKKFLPKSCNFGLIFQRREKNLIKFSNRVKPWGTGHAVLCCQNIVRSNFCVTNADDLYGRDAISKIADFLRNSKTDSTVFANVVYHIANTLSSNGTVSRGLVRSSDGQFIDTIDEVLNINLSNLGQLGITPQTPVSMNLWGFTPKIFEILAAEWSAFVKKITNAETEEFYLSSAIDNAIKSSKCRVKMLLTSSQWHGITYESDNASIEFSLEN